MPPDAAMTVEACQKEKARQRAAEWYRKNKARVIARYHSNPKPDLARSKAWKQKNREKHSAHSSKYYQNHLAYIKEYAKRYRKEHPGAHNAIVEKRRALQRAATINVKHISTWMQSVKSKRTAICYYCQRNISTKEIHFDHIIAIAKGGAHSVENLCVSCPPCNHSKYTKSLNAWVRIGQQVLSL